VGGAGPSGCIIDAWRAICALAPPEVNIMTVKLHKTGYSHARELVDEGKVTRDERDDWSEHQPSAEEENEFIRRHGLAEFGQWHLGVDPDESRDTKAHYKFPYGDLKRVHRCAVISAESRAGQYKYPDIEKAAKHLLELIDAEVAGGSR
jgi:hypothetical protein